MSQEVRACGRAQFARFLAHEGVGEPEAAAMLERLEPLFAAADAGIFPLSDPASIDFDGVAAAIAAAVGRPVRALRPVSVTALAALPGRGSRADALRAAGANLRYGVWLALMFGHSDGLRASLGDERRRALVDAVGTAFGWRLRAAFDSTVPRALGDDLALHAWNSVEETVTCHLGLVLSGDAASAAALTSLIAVLPAAVPICPASDDPRAWIVLVR